MPGSPASSTIDISTRPDPVRWRSWPLHDEPLTSMFLCLAVAGMSAGAGWAAGWPVGVLAAVVQTTALWRWLVPVTYEINVHGVQLRLLGRERRLPWKSIGMAVAGKRGVYLVPLGTGEWFWRLRGWYLSWGHHREAVLACVGFYLLPSQRSD